MDSCMAHRTPAGLRPCHLASATDWAPCLNPADTSSHHLLENGSGICLLVGEVARAIADIVVPLAWNIAGAGRDSFASRLRSALVGLANCAPANARLLILQGTVARRQSRIRILGSLVRLTFSFGYETVADRYNECASLQHVWSYDIARPPDCKLVHARQTR